MKMQRCSKSKCCMSVKQIVKDIWELTDFKDVVNQGVDARLWFRY